MPKARYAFVDGMVVFDVVALEVFPALPAVVEPDGEDPDVVLRAFADQEGIARNAAGLVNEGRGGRGQWVSSSMAPYNDAMVRSYVSWLLMTILPSQTPG